MITYLYWGLVFFIAIGLFVALGVRMGNMKVGLAITAIVLLVAWVAYYFYFQQIFVKRWGGVMSISVPQGQYHIVTTWKDDNLWVENYDPKSNKCIFSEYSRGNLLEGRVVLKDCNPLAAFGSRAQPSQGNSAP
jgi:hypothetical protein